MIPTIIWILALVVVGLAGYLFGHHFGELHAAFEDAECPHDHADDNEPLDAEGFMENTMRLIDVLDALIETQKSHNTMMLQLLRILQTPTPVDETTGRIELNLDRKTKMN